MKNIIVILVALFFFISCKKDTVGKVGKICNVANPAEELPWLKAEIERRIQQPSSIHQYEYIQQGVYEGQTVFIYNNCCPFCVSILSAYACDGTPLGDASIQAVTELKVVWTPSDSECVFTSH